MNVQPLNQPLRLCLVDMNNGVRNEAVRCFRRIFEAFQHRVQQANPGLRITYEHVQPRNLGELPSADVDLIMSSGGPGSPYDGYDEPWCDGYRAFLDRVVDRNLQHPHDAPKLFVVCHSFEITVTHFAVAKMEKRDEKKFGVMPCYTTDEGMRHPLFEPFGDRLFVWEHRSWEARGLDEARLAQLGGRLLARESRDGRNDKGEACLALDFAPGIVGTQFHPEADRAGVIAWITKPEHSAAVADAYGEPLLDRMMKTLADPTRLARTYALLLPGWLQRSFNQLALYRGLRPIGPPELDMKEFEQEFAAAV
ncbi:MAG: hypothetical protein ACK4N5_03495 [Myxococcales bacterium]